MGTLTSQLFSSYRARLLDLASTRLAMKEKQHFSICVNILKTKSENIFLFRKEDINSLLPSLLKLFTRENNVKNNLVISNTQYTLSNLAAGKILDGLFAFVTVAVVSGFDSVFPLYGNECLIKRKLKKA